MKLLESIDSLFLLENGNHVDGLCFSFLEGIGAESVSLSEANNTLLANIELGRSGKFGDVWDGLRLDATLHCGEKALVSIVLNEGLHLIVSVKVDWVSSESDLVLLVDVMSESLDDESNFNPTVRGKHVGAINLVDLKVP